MIMKPDYILFFIILFSFSSFTQFSLEDILSHYRLPYLKKSKLIQISGHDTTGGNNNRINILAGETAALTEIEGP